MVSFENPLLLLLIIPVVAGAIYFVMKGGKRSLILSRMIVLSLLVVAIAGPYTFISEVTQEENPQLVIISDNTDSMQLFEKEVGDEMYESLTAKTPTTFIEIDGDRTPLGDAIMQYSTGDRQIVLVTDGNSNYGADLEEAFEVAKETDTTVYAIVPELMYNDLSVKVEGDKTAVQGNEYRFNLIIEQAEEEFTEYDFSVYADDILIRGGSRSQSERQNTLSVTHTFNTLGAHTLRVELDPKDEDFDSINNEFYKAIYVVPRPEIQYVTDETDAPLSEIVFNLYDASYSSGLKDLDTEKAVIIDNIPATRLSEQDVAKLTDFVSNGGGLVVVGGERSYEYGDYLNSSFETLLPVTSEPTEWRGGRNIVLLLDVSNSFGQGDVIGKTGETTSFPFFEDILGNAVKVIEDEDLRDSYAGVIAFGTDSKEISDGLIYLGSFSNVEFLSEEISKLTPSENFQTTGLDSSLEDAEDWLQNEVGTKDIIIISDGGIRDRYDESLIIAEELKKLDVNFYFVHIATTRQQDAYDVDDVAFAQKFIQNIEGSTKNYFYLEHGERANFDFDDNIEEQPEEDPEETASSWELFELNPTHFITDQTAVSANITGYNDVTPKPGADRIIVASNGKPVLTTWRYGLGRVVTITTDNGKGGTTLWSPQMYSGNNSQLVSASINWAIADPQVKEGAVVQGEDTWLGIPAALTLTMYDEGTPKLSYRGNDLELSLISQDTYEASIDPSTIGVHSVSGYPIAVNYGIEYRDVGVNEELEKYVVSSGGKVYAENEAKALLLSDARENSYKPRLTQVSQKMNYILAALLLFLLEVCLRRGREIIEANRKEKESEK
ncbi:putative membrane protein [Methanohalophilus levihalophilus]|uniref:VWA domain-containing protein n=1 Tax=Methanohalophilus levihalophilus TaxID=1431282 RepID=UPI001AE6D00F|nr:VWA domain-containing protein [Methanohalophilus levihalophilus]MBP2029597.1 putative membrane protein [Methanohalophilus levihalophilus]